MRFQPPVQIRPKLTKLEAEAILEACDHFQETCKSEVGSLNANVARAMRKIGGELVRTGSKVIR